MTHITVEGGRGRSLPLSAIRGNGILARMSPLSDPPPDCMLCPRLASLRGALRRDHPGWFNAPVPSFGDRDAWLAIVGLAPGLKGANRTGRVFTGDGSGAMLFEVLSECGIARGTYGGDTADGLRLDGAIIVNALRCVPPGNRPLPSELRSCRPHLRGTLTGAAALRVIVALGRIAHDATLDAFAIARADHRFAHGGRHQLENGLVLIDSYHCSRYNQNIGRINHNMLRSVFELALRRDERCL